MRYDQFKINLLEAIIDEAEMTPRAFQDFLNSPLVTGMKMGFELESVIHNVRDFNEEPEDDMSYDERTYDIENILEFFRNGDNPNTDRTISELRDKLYEDFMEWQDAEFDDYLRTEEAQTNLKELTREILDDRDYDERQIKLAFDAAEEGKPSEAYVDAEISAMEKIRDEWQDEGSSDWDKYADAMDMNYMSEVYYKYDRFLYWPYTGYGDGEEYLNVEWVADALYDETGIKAVGFDSYHSASRSRAQEKGEWIIEPDSSISADGSDEGGLEFISPALEIPEALKQMQQVLEFVREHGYTNESTGLHINISVPDYNTDKLDYVKLAIFLGDKHVLEQFDRLSNHYCDGAYKKIGYKVQQMKGDELKAVMDKMKEGLTLAASKIIHTGYTNKYTSINTKEGYIEFRGPGGDYLDKNPQELVNTALRMALALRIATDPEMYKQEYQKRLYKVLNDAGEKDELVKFKDYISQYQSADPERRRYILQTIKAEQEARGEKKKRVPGQENPYWMVKRRNGTGGGMAVHAATAMDAVRDVAKSFEQDPIDLYAIPMADEEIEQRGRHIYKIKNLITGQEYRQRADISGDAIALLSARLGVHRRDLSVLGTDDPPEPNTTPMPEAGPMPDSLSTPWQRWVRDTAPRALISDLVETQRRIESGNYDSALDNACKTYLYNYIGSLIQWKQRNEPGIDSDATGDYQLVNSNRSVDRRLTNVTRDEAHRTARRIEQELGLDSGAIHVQKINNQATSGAGGHNWRIYDVTNPDYFTVVASDSRTNAADRWSYVNPELPAERVDAVPDEGAMKYEFTIALQALNPVSGDEGQDRFINPQELYRQRTGRSEIPVRKVWATNKEQAIGKVRTFFNSEFGEIPEDWMKINVVGI